MKGFVIVLGLMCAMSAQARPFAVSAEVGVCETSEKGLRIETSWDIRMPVWIEGMSQKQITQLRWMILADCFNGGFENPNGKQFGSVSEYLQDSVVRKLKDIAENPDDSVTAASLEITANVRIAFVGEKWLGYRYEGYQNEGGNGCHSQVAYRVLSVRDLSPLHLPSLLKAGKEEAFVAWLAKRVQKENKIEATPSEVAGGILKDFIPEKKGVAFCFGAYTLFCGATGITGCTVPWAELDSWCDPKMLKELKAQVAP